MAARKTTAKPAAEATAEATAEEVTKNTRKAPANSAKKTVEEKPSELKGLKKGVDYYIGLRNRFAEGGYETYEELVAAEAE